MIQILESHIHCELPIHVLVWNQEVAQCQKTDNLHIDLVVSDHLHFHDHVKNLVLNMLIVTKNSVLLEIHHVQDTLSILDNNESIDPIIILLSEVTIIDHFLDISLEIDSLQKIYFFISTSIETTLKICVCFEKV